MLFQITGLTIRWRIIWALFFLILNQEPKNISPLSQIELGRLFLTKIYLTKPLYSVTDPLSPVIALLPLAGTQKGKED